MIFFFVYKIFVIFSSFYKLFFYIYQVPLAKSEIYISETLDEVCAAFDNYAKATYKNSGNLVLVDLQNPFNDKSPKMDQVNFIQDGDLNKSLKFLVSL